MGHYGTFLPRLPAVLFFWSLHSRTNSDTGLHVVAYPVKKLCHCLFHQFIVFLCVTLKLFSFSFVLFVPLLAVAPNGDAFSAGK